MKYTDILYPAKGYVVLIPIEIHVRIDEGLF